MSESEINIRHFEPLFVGCTVSGNERLTLSYVSNDPPLIRVEANGASFLSDPDLLIEFCRMVVENRKVLTYGKRFASLAKRLAARDGISEADAKERVFKRTFELFPAPKEKRGLRSVS